MKKYLLSTAILSLALASCQSEDIIEEKQSEIKLTSVVYPMSRGTSLKQQSTQIASGQEVGVIINGAKEAHTNVKWTVGEDGALTNTSTPIYWSNTEATIYAYHPYNSSWSGTDKLESFSVNTDQSTDAGYLNSDLLWATKTGTKTSNPVELSFIHKLAKINVTLTSTDITDLSGATISICGTKTSTSFNPITGELSAASNIAKIKAGVTTTEAYTASAIVVPQTVANGTKFIKVVLGNQTFYYTLPSPKELKSGYSHNYTLTVKEKELEIETESDKITDWTDENGNTGDAEEETVSSKLVTVTIAGTLSTLITEEEKYKITSLTIAGPLNGDDIAYLYTIIPSFSKSGEKGKVTHLDLSSASIVEGGNYYSSLPNLKTENNVIGQDMFSSLELQTLVLPSNIIKIGAGAFSGCGNLKALTIPNGVTTILGGATFAWVNIPLSIPNSVTEIGGAAFVDNEFTSITVEESNSKYDSRNGCNAVIETSTNTLVGGCKETIIPNTIVKIGDYAFAGCDMTTFTIPNSVSTIGNFSFYDCTNLTEIHCKSTNPPTIQSDNFNDIQTTCTLYVPTGSKANYQAAECWKEFTNIVEE